MKRIIKGLALTLVLILILSACTAPKETKEEWIRVEHDAPDLTVHFIDVGQGAATLLESDGAYLLYDGGPSDASSKVVAYLKAQGVETLDVCIASHFDDDHLSGIVGALHAFRVNRLLAPPYQGEGRLYESFCRAAKAQGLTAEWTAVGNQFFLGDALVTLLSPWKEYENENDRSIALLVRCGETAFLFGGDAERESEADMLASGIPLDADVYAVSHHGSNDSSSAEFLRAVSPAAAVVSCGEGNPYGHPGKETMERLRLAGCDIYRTDIQGDIVAVSDGTSVSWSVPPAEHGGEATPPPTGASDAEYVLNTKTKRFHLPDCGSVQKTKAENCRDYTGDREALIRDGYTPCGSCQP